MNPLKGLQVVITRPEPQASKWQALLHQQGATTFLLPVMEIAPLKNLDQQKISEYKNKIAKSQALIFVSQNAVAYAKSLFSELPSHLSVYAVGSATAKALIQWGVSPESAKEAMNSEDLLKLESLQSVKNQKILICRGIGGREALASSLKKRGAIVEYLELYERKRHSDAVNRLKTLPWTAVNDETKALKQDNSGANAVVSAHSGESVQWLFELLQENCKSDISKAWPLLVPGERVNKIAQSLGFSQTLIAKNASDSEMSRCLIKWWQSRLKSE